MDDAAGMQDYKREREAVYEAYRQEHGHGPGPDALSPCSGCTQRTVPDTKGMCDGCPVHEDAKEEDFWHE